MRSILLLSTCLLLAGSIPAVAADHEIGGGIHFWAALSDLDDSSLEEDGASWLVAYQIDPFGPFAFEFDVEVFEDGFAGSPEQVIVPQAYVLFGGLIYGGVGVGYTLADDFEGDETFFAARVGLDMTLLPRFHLDLNARYQADSFSDLDGATSDSVTLGAMVRFRVR